ncbi:MAG: flagellar filament capping protein FliD [Labilithrix sp.]|nr:flagellar filament capping protein FliD [Labilithrix sp.]
MAVSLGGLASGIDTGALVDGLMGVARQPIAQIETKKLQTDAAAQTITSLSSKLAALKTAALALSTPTGFSSFAATSNDPAIVATTTGSASIGSFDVEVAALARAQKSRSETFASSAAALGFTGSLDIQMGAGSPVTVDVLATDSLGDIAAKISSSGARVSASVIFDGTSHRLLLQGLDTGAANEFTVTENGVSLGFSLPGSTYETAQDASLTIDGIAITSPSNQVTGAIAGVKLALTKVTTSPATVSIAADPTALEQKLTAFVTAYNDVVNSGHAAAGFGAQKAQNPLLAADSAVRTALHRLGKLISDAVPGATGSHPNLRSMGLITKADGTLSLDKQKLAAAMSADPDAVRRLFVTDAVTGATGMMSTLMSTVDGLVTKDGGAIKARIAALGAKSKRLATTKTKMEGRLVMYGEQLRKQFSNMDQAVGRYQSMSSAISNMPKLGGNNL